MAKYSKKKINSYLTIGSSNANTAIKGKAFEDLVCYLFEKIPGVEITQRNEMNTFQTEEIDVAVWNDKKTNGLPFLPNIILIECKNWSNPVSSIEVNWFCSKVESRGREFGILIANNGITGNNEQLTAAHSIIARHLENKREIIVITKTEIQAINDTKDLIKLIKTKLCHLAVSVKI